MHDLVGRLLGLNSSDPSVKSLRKILNAHSTILDIGANQGDFAMLCRAAVPEVQLILVEPQPELKFQLEKILNPKDLYLGLAVSDTIEISFLSRRHENDRKAFLSNKRTNLPVQVSTVDTIISEHNIKLVDLLKIDTEGNDFKVLKGAENNIFDSKIRNILFEINYKTLLSGISPEEIEGWLRARNFSYFYRATRNFGFIPVNKLTNYRVETQNILATREKL
jgi:FkbM family methyltransferase